MKWFIIFVSLGLIGSVTVLGGASSPSSQPASKLQSELKVVVDESAAEDNRLEPQAITEAADRFIASHESFSLSELENLKIHSPKGRDVLLQEVASVQVQFHRNSH